MPQDLAALIWPRPEDVPEKQRVQNQTARAVEVVDQVTTKILQESAGLSRPIPATTLAVLVGEIAISLAPVMGSTQAREVFSVLLDLMLTNYWWVQQWVTAHERESRQPALRLLLSKVISETELRLRFAQRTKRDADLEALVSDGAPEIERLVAASRLASAAFATPIPTKRWNAHRIEIEEAIRERAKADPDNPRSRDAVLKEVTEGALIVSGLESSQSHPYVFLTVDGQLRKIVCAPGDLIPKLGLPEQYFDTWFRARVAREVLGTFVPDWEERERRRRFQREQQRRTHTDSENEEEDEWADPSTAVEMSLDELRARAGERSLDQHGDEDPLNALIAAESAREKSIELSSLLGKASSQQRELIAKISELLKQGYPVHGARAAAARSMGIPESQARKQLQRLRNKHKPMKRREKKNSRR